MTYQFLPGLFLRAPFYSYHDYDPDRMPEVLGRQSFRNAIHLASEDFYAVLEKKGFDYEKLSEKERHSLTKYYNRMCFRPTPFGCFASFTVLDWDRATAIRLTGDSEALLHLLPDQSTLNSLNKLQSSHLSRELRVNPTLYAAGPTYRFIRSTTEPSGQSLYSLDTLDLLPFHTQLIAKVKESPLTANDLVAWIAADTGCPLAEAVDYVEFLCKAQVLFGPERGQIISAAGRQNPYADLSKTVSTEQPLPSSPGPYYAATERALLSGKPDKGTREELSRAVAALARLSPVTGQPALEAFTAAFTARYDRRKVPLLEALDPDMGIGYGGLSAETGAHGLLEDLPFDISAVDNATAGSDQVRQLLFRLWPRRRGASLTLQDADLQELSPSALSEQPSTLAVLFRRAEGLLLIEHVGGATANALTGRFSVFSKATHDLCLEIAARERASHPGILFADIGQFSDPHTDNINWREQIYEQEIPLNTFSALDPAAQIWPGDLLLSVANGALILESASRGRRVIPRLPTAYNFRKNSLAVYRLLCDLQYQGLRSAQSLDIERLFPGLDHYPRVTIGRNILNLARWKVSKEETASLISGQESPAGLRTRTGLPQHISMGREDQQLVFDLAEPEEAALFLRCLKPGEPVTLYEYLWPDRSVKTEKRPLAAQFLAVLAHDSPVYEPLTREERPVDAIRDFRAGSEWLYLKIYCTPRTAGLILRDVVGPLIRRKKKQILGWFFIRYADNGYHIRLRFRAKPEQTGSILTALNSALQRAGYDALINDFQCGVYTRELERYGADIIEAVEAVFQAGSELALVTGDDAFAPAMAVTAAMISVFFELPEAISFSARSAENFLTEFGGTKALRTGLDQKYRKLKNEMARELSGPPPPETSMLLDLLRRIRETSTEWPEGRRSTLLGDLIHMQLNRAFSTDSRRHELLVYYCLNKHLISLAKRKEAQ